MGWQCQHIGHCGRLEEADIVRSMPRKGNRVDDGATNQVFGHLKDGFFRSREFPDFEAFNRELEEHIECWNTQRRRVKLKGLTPKEFRSQSTAA